VSDVIRLRFHYYHSTVSHVTFILAGIDIKTSSIAEVRGVWEVNKLRRLYYYDSEICMV
jgi:hypothetical protein